MYTRRIKLDVTPGGEPKVVHVSQYDADSRTLEFELYSSGAEFTLPSGATAEINGTKPDGNGFSYTASLSENVVTVELTEQMAAVAGKVPCKIIVKKDNKKLLTEKFILSVDRAALDKDTLLSGSEIRELVDVIDRTDEIIAAAHEASEAVDAVTAAQMAAETAAANAADAKTAAETAQEAAETAAAAIAETKREIDDEAEMITTQRNAALTAIRNAKDNAVGVVDDKAQDVAQMKSNAEAIAAQALAAANNLGNEFADVEASAEQLRKAVVSMQLLLNEKVDGGYADSQGYLHLTANGDDVGSKIGPFAGGSGGGGASGGNNAEFTARNATGWISTTIAEGDNCEVKIEWSSIEESLPTGKGILRVYVGGAVKASPEVDQGIVSFDVSKYLSVGSNLVTFNIADIYGNNRSFNVSVAVEILTITSTFDNTTQYEGPILFPYTPQGALSKTIYFYLDGNLLDTYSTSVSNRQLTYTIPQQTHGMHSLRCYFECEINNRVVRSNELYYEITCIEPLNNETIITSSYNKNTVDQYTTIQLPFTVYNRSSMTVEVKIYAGETLLTTQTVDRTEQSYSYRANDAGTLTLRIVSGTAEKTFTITVTPSEIDVEAETDSLALYLSAEGRSNNEANPGTWEYGNISATFTGFNFASDGWQTDDDGITVLRVSGDARVNIPYQPFASDFRSTGKTIELEFATRNVLNYDTPILSCMSGGRGVTLTAQQATLTSEQSSISAQYKEEEHIRISFVAEKRAENRLLYIYINGISSGVVQYPADDDFAQVTPVNISVGANDCTIDLYCIRVYDNDLTRYQILDNWIADTQVGAEMLARYSRNNVYDEYGNIVIAKLPSDLPYMILEADELPQYKGDKKTISVSYVDPVYPTKSFTATGVQANVQGTSSATYARKNYDLQFKAGFETRSGHEDNYELRSGVIPFNRYVLKADVASSEGANNVELVRLYNDICPYKTPEMQADSRVRWGIDGFPIVVFWHDTVTDTVKFHGKYNFNLPKRAPEPYGYSGDMESWEFQNNTSNLMLFKSDFFDETMYTDPDTGDTKELWRYDYEARFPSDEWTDYTKLQEFQSFIVSTDREQATNDALENSVTYDGTTYTTDTADYRLAKFKAEFGNYAEVDSFIFYYIFTELYLMVDSRAKNLFIGFNGSATDPMLVEHIDRKAVAQPYDMDTALGTNNEGSLVFGYSLEDTDHLTGGANVFNGQDSVLWCNLRDSYGTEVVRMYQMLRSSGGLSYAETERRYEEHQAKWPEAVWNEDIWYKYICPLIAPDPGKEATAVYLPMDQGSKEEQRKWWLINRFKYKDSKWNAGDALAQVIQLRGYAKADITVTPYADIYPTIKYASYLVRARGTHGVPTTLACPLDSVNDTEIYIYSAPQLASVGDLSGLKVGFADFSMATRLQSIKLGDASPSYENQNLNNLTLGSNVLLKTLDVRNCTALGTGDQKTVDLSGCEILEEVYFDGTQVTGVTLPRGGVLRIVHLPETTRNLTIIDQTKITDLTVASYNNITTLRIENSSVDERDILHKIPAATRVRLTGVTWEATGATEISQIFDLLDTMRGLDENGNNTDTAQVSGTIHTSALTGAEIAAFNARYPYIKVVADHVTSYLTYKSYDGSSTIKTVTCLDGVPQEAAPAIPARSQTTQYTYTAVGWNSMQDAQAAEYPIAGPTTGMQADTTLYAAYSRTLQTYTAVWKNSDGTVLETDNNVPYGSMPQYNGSTPQNPTSGGGAFQGWTPAVSNVTGNVTYTASYVVTYTVYFYNGSTLLQTVTGVAKGGSATYTGSTPTKTGVDNPEEYTFNGWSPSPTNIQGNTSCYAQYDSPVQDVEITDSWDTIIANIDNGTYKTKYKIGNYKPLDLGTEGTINMQIVAIDTDDLASGGKAPITFIAKELLTTSHNMNSSGTTSGGWSSTEMRTYLKNTVKPLIQSNVRSRINAVTKYSRLADGTEQTTTDDVWIPSRREVGITQSAESSGPAYSKVYTDATSRIKKNVGASYNSGWWLRSAGSTSHFGRVDLYGNCGDVKASDTYGIALGFCLGLEADTITDSWDDIITATQDGSYSTKYKVGDTKTLDLGTEGKVKMQLVAMDADELADGSGKAKTTWISKELLNTSHRMNPSRTAGTSGTGSIGGWEVCEMRSYLRTTVKPLIPSNVRSAIKEVTKYSRIYNTSETAVNNVTSTDDVWIPSHREIFNDTSYETNGPVYSDGFTDAASRIKKKIGASSDSWWWLRSAADADPFRYVGSNGASRSTNAGDSGGVALGFCI